MADDKQYKIIQGTVISNKLIDENNYYVLIDNKDIPQMCTMNRYRIINKPKMIIKEHDVVSGWIVKTSYSNNIYKEDKYAFYINDNESSKIDNDDFCDIIDMSVVSHINQAGIILQYPLKNNLDISVLKEKTRKDELYIARYICIYFATKYLIKYDHTKVCARYNLKRLTYHALKTLEDYISVYPKFKQLIQDIETDLNTVYNNIRRIENGDVKLPFYVNIYD